MVLAAIGLGVSVVGSVFGGRSEKKAAKRAAANEARKGRFESAKFRAAAKRLQSRQLTSFAKSGVAIHGTPVEVMAQTAAEQELEALAIAEGISSSTAAILDASKARQQANLIQTTGTLLTGLSQLRSAGQGN
jgi:hypothetical protein